mgnify:CR=1 FL=1
MKFIYNNIGFLVLSLVVASCSLSKRQTANEANGSHKIKLIVLDPGHFHASLLQKDTLTDVNDTIHVYAPEGQALTNIWKVSTLTTNVQRPPPHG